MTSIPSYNWGESPDNLLTKKQLAELGLKPKRGVKPVARVVWNRGRDYANLFDKGATVAKVPPTDAQIAAVAKAREKAKENGKCPGCGLLWTGGQRCEGCIQKQDHDAVIQQARLILANPDDYVILDTETTGLRWDDEIIEIAVLGIDGAVLLDSRVKPVCKVSEGARQVHGISDEDLVDAPSFWDIYPALRSAVGGKNIVIYNAKFDKGKVWNCIRLWALEGLGAAGYTCAMEMYAAYCGEWSEYWGNYKWQKLPGAAHGALADCRAVLGLLGRMTET